MNTDWKGSESSTKADSPSSTGRTASVGRSPLNGVKLELALVVIGGVVLTLIHGKLTADSLSQLLILIGYGTAAMSWLIFRTRRVLAQYNGERGEGERQKPELTGSGGVE